MEDGMLWRRTHRELRERWLRLHPVVQARLLRKLCVATLSLQHVEQRVRHGAEQWRIEPSSCSCHSAQSLASSGRHSIRGAGVQQTGQLVWANASHESAGTLRVLIRVFQGRLHLCALQVAAIIWRRRGLRGSLRRQVRWRGIRRLWIRLLRCR